MGPSVSAGPSLGRHAVVIGGSMAGLLAARVLADHFDQVTIVERDRLPEGPRFRAGVPQSRHLHVLLGRGRLLLEGFFPGLIGELRAAGAVTFDWPGDTLWLGPAGWGRRFRPGLEMLSASRELLEWGVRHRLEAAGRVRFLEEREAVGLVADGGGARVAAVRLRQRGAAEAGDDTGALPADLVVDASGRHSHAPRWLVELGYAPPREVTVNAFLGYASRIYAAPRDLQLDWQALFFQAQPPANGRGGALFPIEGGRWIVTLAGTGRDYPPTDEVGFLDFARSLRSPILYQAIHAAEALSPIAGYQRTENRLRRYERLARWPERFAVLGDAVCAFNPIYGQGMTVAALAAQLLDRCLVAERRRPNGDLAELGRRFQRGLARANALPWLMATGEDLRYPTTAGGRPSRATRLAHRYLDRLQVASAQHRQVSLTFLRVLHLLAPPIALVRPEVLVPTLRASARSGLQAPPTTTPLAGAPAMA